MNKKTESYCKDEYFTAALMLSNAVIMAKIKEQLIYQPTMTQLWDTDAVFSMLKCEVNGALQRIVIYFVCRCVKQQQ